MLAPIIGIMHQTPSMQGTGRGLVGLFVGAVDARAIKNPVA